MAAFIPLLENILMLQHATQFSFDRLKFVVPASIILGFSFVNLKLYQKHLFIILTVLSCFFGWNNYKDDLCNYSKWGAIDIENHDFIYRLKKKYDFEYAVLSTNTQVRAYSNLILHRGIFEHKLPKDAMNLISINKVNVNIYIEGHNVFTDLPQYTKAIATFSDGHIETTLNKYSK